MRLKLIFAALVATFNATAQNAAPYWSLSGNSNASASSVLGTTNSIPLRLFTNNAERIRIDAAGKVSIGTPNAYGKLTLLNQSSIPASPWRTTGSLFTGFSESTTGSADFVVGMATNTATSRPVYIGKRSRGTLAAPLAVANNDQLFSLLSSAYDGRSFQFPASIDFAADGIPSAGKVPTRISFVTGVNGSTRKERMRIGSNGDIVLNNGQAVFRSNGNLREVAFNNNQIVMTNNYNEGYLTRGNIKLLGNKIYATENEGDVNFDELNTFSAFYSVSQNLGLYTRGLGTGLKAVGGVIDEDVMGTNMDAGVEALGWDLGVYAEGEEYGVIAKGDIGIYATGDGWTGEAGTGVWGEGGSEGVLGSSTGILSGDPENNLKTSGVYGFNETIGVGVRGVSEGIGVHGTSNNSYGVFGTTNNTSSYAGYFTGRVFGSGGFFSTSDGRLKQNIKDLPNAMDLISKLRPKSYEYRQEGAYKLMNLPQGKHYGLVAQEVEEVLPHLVNASGFNTAITHQPPARDSLGKVATQTASNEPSEKVDFKAVNYTELIPILIKGMQEQQAKIEKLEAELAQLKSNSPTNLSLSNAYIDAISPNPVRGSASLRYQVPGEGNAKLLVTDATGRTVKAVQLKGSGVLNLNTSALASGVYNYSLLVDGKTVETKKMTVLR